MSRNYTISLIQMKIEPGKLEANLGKATSMIKEAIRASSKLIVLPEMFATGFHYRELKDLAKKTPAVIKEMKNIAVEGKTNLVFSVPEEGNGKVFNTAFVIDEKGRLRGKYRKVHLFGLFREDKHFARGRETKVFDLGGLRVAPLICYDLRFPELSRKVTLKGAHLIIYPSQWPRERIPHWVSLLTARAIENQLFVAGANGCGKSGSINLGGNSIVVSPYGEIIARAKTGESILTAKIELDEITEFREKMPCLKDRFPEAY